MALLKPDFLRKHPVLAGLFWAALFVPLLALLTYLQGDSLEVVPFAAFAAVPAGIAWGYFMRWYLNRRQGNAG